MEWVQSFIDVCSPRDLANTVWSIARLQWMDASLSALIATTALSQIAEMNVQALSCTLSLTEP